MRYPFLLSGYSLLFSSLLFSSSSLILGHPSWVLMQNIQIGIRHNVGKQGELIDESEMDKVKDIHKHESFFRSPKVMRFPPYVFFSDHIISTIILLFYLSSPR